MLTSLIAVCLMVAVQAHNHKEYAPYGYPMNDHFAERHRMHRDPQMYRDQHFYGPANPASYYQGPFYDGHHYDEPNYEVPYYMAHNNGFQPHMRSEYEPNHYFNQCSRRNMNYDDCSKKTKPVYRNSEHKSCPDHKNYTPDNHEN